MLQLSAIDALLHRVADDAVLKWLNGGSRSRNAVPLAPKSSIYHPWSSAKHEIRRIITSTTRTSMALRS